MVQVFAIVDDALTSEAPPIGGASSVRSSGSESAVAAAPTHEEAVQRQQNERAHDGGEPRGDVEELVERIYRLVVDRGQRNRTVST